jgi:hypothetical protein
MALQHRLLVKTSVPILDIHLVLTPHSLFGANAMMPAVASISFPLVPSHGSGSQARALLEAASNLGYTALLDPLFVQQLLILNTLFLCLHSTDLDKQGL